MISDTTALAKQGADEDLELADEVRGVGAVLVNSVEKLRFVAGTWSARHSAERSTKERGRGKGEEPLTLL